MKLFFYTNNRFKFRVADEIFSRYEIGLFIVKPDFKEIQAEKSEDKVVDAFNKDRKSTRLNSSHTDISRMPSSA